MKHSFQRMLKRGFNGFHGTFTRLHPFKSPIFYSTSATSHDGITTPPTVEYLVKFVGFSPDEAVSIATKVSPCLKSSKSPKLAVDFLKSSGFDGEQIRKVVSMLPFVLHSDVEKTLKPKVRAFQELGLRGSDLGSVISQHPHVLNRSLESHIIPTLELLKSLLGSNEQLIKLLLKTKSQLLLSSNVLKNLPDNLALLQSYGFPSEKIKPFLLRRPILLMQRTQWLEEKLKGVEEKLGIPRTSSMFFYGVCALSMMSEDRLESCFQVFYNYGWSETEILELIRRHPLILNLSERILRVKLKYFMEDLGYGSDYFATRPCLLSFSLEKRILPRTAVIQALKKKKLLKKDVGLYTYMSKTESKFVEKYVLPFKEKLPKLYECYMQQTTGVSLSKT